MALSPLDPSVSREPSSSYLLSSRGAGQTTLLTRRLVAEMARRWRAGERPPAEEFLARHPELQQQPDAAVDLVYEEICQRQELGEEAASVEVLARFPQWRAELEVLLQCHRMLEPTRTAPRFPQVGEDWGDFHLVAELGRGAQGCVFLATQLSLADRPLVVKLTPRHGQEHLALARLQHTNIVPLYTVQDDPESNLRLLCMPHFGGASLARILDLLADVPPAQRTGQDLLDALDQLTAALPLPCPTRGPARQFLSQASYVDAICLLGDYLADGLQYAHERGLVHLDLKPSNVLLAADGTPMLLDFHLAREPIQPDGPPPDWLGGTPGYMSPEQKAAVQALCDGRPVPAAVDGRSDVYSLGLLLYEALGGPVPLPPTGPVRLNVCNPAVSPGLAAILGKCLESDPSRRYARAADLAADLYRHRHDEPLLGVRERFTEGWRKRWRRQSTTILPWFKYGGLTGGLLLLAAALLFSLRGWHALSETTAQVQEAAERARTEADEAHVAAERDQARKQLHYLADQLRLPAGDLSSQAHADLEKVDAACRQFWVRRELLRSPTEKGNLVDEEAAGDLLDLAVLWPDLHVYLAAPGEAQQAAHEEGLVVLSQAEELLGPGAVLEHVRQRHLEALGRQQLAHDAGRRAKELPARTAWEHTALGRSFLQAGDFPRAEAELSAACRLQPKSFAPHFFQGVAAYRLEHYDAATLAFTYSLALAPTPRQEGQCLLNRARALAAGRHIEQARQDYEEAARLDPALKPACLLSRGILAYQARHPAEALQLLQEALQSGADPALVYYNRSLVQRDQGDRRAALASVEEALRHRPDNREARQLRAELQRPR